MKQIIGVISAALILAGCQTAQQSQADPEMVWTQANGQPIPGNAQREQNFTLAVTVCKGEAQKANVAAGPVYWRGLAGAISAEITLQKRNVALLDVVKGCMAERGYLYVSRSTLPASRRVNVQQI